MNLFEQCIMFSVIKNKHLNFAQVIFDQMADIIGGTKRSAHVPYPRWFALILKYFVVGYDDDQADDWAHSFTSMKLFNQIPEDEWSITKGMQIWIDNPFPC